MIKIVRVPFDDILFDPEEAGEMLTACQRRQRKMRLAGAAAADRALAVLFEDTAVRSDTEIVLAPLKNTASDELTAEISERYEHGFTLRCSFRIRDKVWALFELSRD
ncbi:MAG: hypothetical protein IJS14_02800 [Lentisphaeria bacterium]|nr:hypothetical protein [Lentisphaeria bacterium]